MTGASLYVATQSFVVTSGNERMTVKKGDLVRAGHPLLAARPDLFESAATYRPEVEQATIAPGEKR